MSHKILVVGGLGNMGSRYCAILKSIGVEYEIIDVVTTEPVSTKGFTGIIIATPTDTHYDLIKEYKKWNLPILCEKAITKSKKELEEILSWKINLRMINQYEYYFKHDPSLHFSGGYPNHYNFFKSGTDGLLWDCINVIGTNDDSEMILASDSPVWSCQIRGKILRIEEMDFAYMWNITHWLNTYRSNFRYIEYAHKKVINLIENYKDFKDD